MIIADIRIKPQEKEEEKMGNGMEKYYKSSNSWKRELLKDNYFLRRPATFLLFSCLSFLHFIGAIILGLKGKIILCQLLDHR